MSNDLTLHPVNGEPRIKDLDLAERLEFADPAMVRKLIKRNEAKLLAFGVISTVEKTSGASGGRPATEFYLNQRQALFICMKSETEKAFDVQADIIRVYDDYLNGEKQPAIPKTYAAALRLAADQQELIEAQQRQIEAAQPAVQFHDEVIQDETGEFTVSEACKTLFHRAVKERDLRAWLMRNQWLCKRNNGNEPTAHAMDSGWMRSRLDYIPAIRKTVSVPVLTGKGLALLRHLYRTGELFTAVIPAARLLPAATDSPTTERSKP